MLCGFEPSILFLILWCLYDVHITSELLLLCIKCWFQAALHVFFPQHVAAHNLSAKGEVSFPLAWIGRFFREKKQWIISAVAEGCREVVWHRHWLSLLRSEGIVRLRKKKRKERREVSERMNKTANWIGWDASVLGMCWLFIFLFLYFFATCCSGWTSNQSCFPNSRPSGERMDKQITDQQEEAELDHVPHCLLAGLSFDSWPLFGGKKPQKSWNPPCLQSHVLMKLIGRLDMRTALRRPA